VRRRSLDQDWLEELRERMPAVWRDNEVVLLEYASAVPCLLCGNAEKEVLALRVRFRVGSARMLSFCGDDCLLDALHTRGLES
jgi:hypothetical protein